MGKIKDFCAYGKTYEIIKGLNQSIYDSLVFSFTLVLIITVIILSISSVAYYTRILNADSFSL